MRISLLSTEEASKLPKEILKCKTPKEYQGLVCYDNCEWWLRSPGECNEYAAHVYTDGEIGFIGDCVDNFRIGVRPCIFMSKEKLSSLPRTKKGYVKLLNTKWYDISEYIGTPCILKKKCLKKTSSFALYSNVYEESWIKCFIEKWYIKKCHRSYMSR